MIYLFSTSSQLQNNFDWCIFIDRAERHDFWSRFFAIHSPFLLSFIGRKRKGEENNQSRDKSHAFLLYHFYRFNINFNLHNSWEIEQSLNIIDVKVNSWLQILKINKKLLSFLSNSDDYLDLYIRNLENPHLKPGFR